MPILLPTALDELRTLCATEGMPIWTQIDSLCDKAACPVAPGPTQVREGGAGAGAEAEAEAACLRRRMVGALGWRVPA